MVTDFANRVGARVEFSCVVCFSVCDHDDVHASWWEDQDTGVLFVKSQVTLSSLMSVDGSLYPLLITVLCS